MTIEKVFYDLCDNTGSPFSLGLWLRYRLAPAELTTASIDPLDYNDPVSFGNDYACLSFLRKFRGLDTGINLQEEAILSFRKAEEKCSKTNDSLQIAFTTGRLARTGHDILYRAQELMKGIWGNPTFSDLFGSCAWGPGSTSTLRGVKASREDKMSQFPVSLTPTAIPYFRAVIREDYAWLRHILKQEIVGPVSLLENCFESVDSSRLLTVPKDAKTDRTIAAEPTGNIYLQKGIGHYLRKRLRRFGINLDDQSVNQELARSAYFKGLATIDLASASDTISIAVVKLLCPSSMFGLLDRLRSPSYRWSDRETRFHKFSSMGNGFTFELESSIFYCLVRAVAETRLELPTIGVYGDDIVCDQLVAHEVIECLEDCGFEVNTKKSFLSGPFYESCGKHFFHGIDVTPPYQKNLVTDELEYVRMYNRLFDWVQKDIFDVLGRRKQYGKVLGNLIRARPGILRKEFPHGPSWVSGDGFFKVFEPREVPYRVDRGYKIKYLVSAASTRRLADGGLYADELRIGSKRGEPHWADPPKGMPTNGYVDLRKVNQTGIKVAYRWVSAAFGRTDI